MLRLSRCFFAVALAVVVGYLFTTRIANPTSAHLFFHLFPQPSEGPQANLKAWSDLLGLFAGLCFTLPLAWFTSVKMKYETLNVALKNYFSIQSAFTILVFIVLYKLGDAFAGSLLTPFLLKGMGFWLLATLGKGAWGDFQLPAFDFFLVSLKEPTQVDSLLVFALSVENVTSGMGTTAFVALLMALPGLFILAKLKPIIVDLESPADLLKAGKLR